MVSLTPHELNLVSHQIILYILHGKNSQNFSSETCLNQYSNSNRVSINYFLTVIFNRILQFFKQVGIFSGLAAVFKDNSYMKDNLNVLTTLRSIRFTITQGL